MCWNFSCCEFFTLCVSLSTTNVISSDVKFASDRSSIQLNNTKSTASNHGTIFNFFAFENSPEISTKMTASSGPLAR